MTKPAKSICPQCNGTGVFAVNSADGRRLIARCGTSICQAAEEDRIVARLSVGLAKMQAPDVLTVLTQPENLQRLLASIMRHMPSDITRGAKRT
jgi:hypothetical protein